MIPDFYDQDLIQDYTTQSHPSKTYKINFDGKPSKGYIAGLEAIKQAIFLMLSIERFRYEIFSWDYGIELEGKIGIQNSSLLQLRIKKALEEALMSDDRVLTVDEFVFDRSEKSKLLVHFVVKTTEGTVPAGIVLADDGRQEVII